MNSAEQGKGGIHPVRLPRLPAASSQWQYWELTDGSLYFLP